MGSSTVWDVSTSYGYSYRAASTLTPEHGLTLATSGGTVRSATGRLAPAESPVFFSGFAVRPGLVAAGLLAVAEVARARYHRPVVVDARDPVVSCDGEVLRCESFSDCCGVGARLDLLPQILDGAMPERGTTNVDVNEPLRRALARTGDSGLLHLAVGTGELAVTTGDGAVIERKVPLPERWLRGFAEVQVLSAGLDLRAELGPAAAATFLRSLPTGSANSGVSWVVPAGAGLRLTSRPVPGALCVAGPHRLVALRPLLRFARALRGYGPPVGPGSGPVVSAWEVDLPGARLVLTLSPQVHRGFSGEGSVLAGLSSEGVTDDAEAVLSLLEDLPGVDVDVLRRRTGLDAAAVRAALTWLGASGRVGYDVTQVSYYPRELPYLARAAERGNPRLVAARALVAAGQVRLGEGPDAVADVVVDGRLHRVRRQGEVLACTCTWYAAYRTGRGPCKHALAVEIAERGR